MMDEEERRARQLYLMTLPWSAELQLWWAEREEKSALRSGDLVKLRDARQLLATARKRIAARREDE
jgi:hypothetical protein